MCVRGAGVQLGKLLLDRGDIVLIADSQGVRDIVSADGTARLPAAPLAVIVNKGTASASEVRPCGCRGLPVQGAQRGAEQAPPAPARCGLWAQRGAWGWARGAEGCRRGTASASEVRPVGAERGVGLGKGCRGVQKRHRQRQRGAACGRREGRGAGQGVQRGAEEAPPAPARRGLWRCVLGHALGTAGCVLLRTCARHLGRGGLTCRACQRDAGAPGSASHTRRLWPRGAWQVLAGALKDNKRATVVGSENTFGKGLIQTIVDLSDGSGVAITVARSVRPWRHAAAAVARVEERPGPAAPASASL